MIDNGAGTSAHPADEPAPSHDVGDHERHRLRPLRHRLRHGSDYDQTLRSHNSHFLPSTALRLAAGVIYSSVSAILRPSARGSVTIPPCKAAAAATAVALPAITRLANSEGDSAPATKQQVQQYRPDKAICHLFPGQIAQTLASSGRDLSHRAPVGTAIPPGLFLCAADNTSILARTHLRCG